MAVLEIMSMRDTQRFTHLHHGVLTESMGVDIKHQTSDLGFRYYSLQVDVPSICVSVLDCTQALKAGELTSWSMTKQGCDPQSRQPLVAAERSLPR